MKIIDTELTKITLPVRPGRNLAVIIEVAAMNFPFKTYGSQCGTAVLRTINECD